MLNESSAALDFLGLMTRDLVRESSVPPGHRVGASPANSTGGTLVKPGGRECYPSFWIRDFAMSLESGAIPREIALHAIGLTALSQADEERELPSGARIPAGAIADHIRFDGVPIYFPGTYEAGEQGGEIWGMRPSLDDQFYFIRMAAWYAAAFDDAGILAQRMRGKSLLERLALAFALPSSAEGSQLVACGDEDRGINFGFMDSIRQTGSLFFASALKCLAARDMAILSRAAGRDSDARRYEAIGGAIREELPVAFAHESGLLKASTGRSGQPDVWGSAFAVSSGLLSGPAEARVCARLAKAYREGSLSWKGNIRHVPTTDDFGPESCWEATLTEKNRYQNGAYWGTPLGWVADAVSRADPGAALELFLEYAEELREGDYRRGELFDSPVECMHPEGGHRQNPLYMASVACPLPALRKLYDRGPRPVSATSRPS
jgi:hypothetical protein